MIWNQFSILHPPYARLHHIWATMATDGGTGRLNPKYLEDPTSEKTTWAFFFCKSEDAALCLLFRSKCLFFKYIGSSKRAWKSALVVFRLSMLTSATNERACTNGLQICLCPYSSLSHILYVFDAVRVVRGQLALLFIPCHSTHRLLHPTVTFASIRVNRDESCVSFCNNAAF